METEILDFFSQDKEYFSATRKPMILVLHEKKYLTLEGQGTPENIAYHTSIEAIYSAAFQLKFLHKKKGEDFRVSKLECLWWVDENKNFLNTPMEEWHWKLLIRIPDFVTTEEVREVAMKIMEERGLREVSKLQADFLKEGKCVQVLHQGPYDKVGDTYEKLLEFMENSGFQQNGAYHEIYISDPNRTVPEKIKTIVRQPVK